MKKNVLALSIATMIGGLGFTGAALALPGDVAVNPNGDGHILMVPYYTVQDGNVTAFNIVNTDTTNGKAVKVRFRGASNSDDVLDFQVFLSPGDVWSAAVTADANGLAQLVTADNSCTVPKIELNTPVPFIKDRLTKTGWTDADKNAQTREGYIEILNMADIDGADYYNASTGLPAVGITGLAGAEIITVTSGGSAKSALYKATKHDSGVAPCTPATLARLDNVNPLKNVILKGAAGASAAGAFADAAGVALVEGLTPPTGGLTGNWFIMNAEKSTTFSAAATAIQEDAASTPVNVYSPQRNIPAALLTADPLMRAKLIEAQAYDVPDLSTQINTTDTTPEERATKVSDAISQTVIANQFLADSKINAATDWVISMPTRRYTVAANYSAAVGSDYGYVNWDATGLAANGKAILDEGGAVTAVGDNTVMTSFTSNTDDKTKAYRVFNSRVHAAAASGALTNAGLFGFSAANSTVNAAGQICGTADSQTFYDRSENSVKDGAVFSPGTATKLSVCGETSVVTFGAKSPTGAALAATKASTTYTEGWGHVSFARGVPVLGAAFTAASNPSAAAGMIGNYGITWPHFYSIK